MVGYNITSEFTKKNIEDTCHFSHIIGSMARINVVYMLHGVPYTSSTQMHYPVRPGICIVHVVSCFSVRRLSLDLTA